jgi:hypothetical protein
MEEKLFELLSVRRQAAAVRVARLANELWKPAACPLCAAGVPFSNPSA